MAVAPATAPDVSLAEIESWLSTLITPLTVAPATRDRPEVLPGALLWSAMLVCLLRREPYQRAIWRLVSQVGLWHFPTIPISAEGVRKRLKTAGSAPMATLFAQITAAGHWYITRLTAKTTCTSVHVLTNQRGIRDELVWLGRYRADKAGHLVRLITLLTSSGERRYVTNVRDPRLLPSQRWSGSMRGGGILSWRSS